MFIISYVLLGVGGVTLFLLGLKTMSENMEKLAGAGMKKVISSFTKNAVSGVITGAVSTAVMQSSIATNVILVGFVSSGIITFYQASAVVMGANVGTTVTAQLVSLSGSDVFDITAFGSLIAFIGFLISFSKRDKVCALGNVMAGFGMLFFGLDVVSNAVSVFKNYDWFRSVFLVKSDILLLFNGILITAIVQSSSAVTGVMIILASSGLIGFEASMFLTLGANVGTCFSVIIASLDKPAPARQTAFFNLAFNLVGSLLLFVPLSLLKTPISKLFASFSGTVERQIANFHTLFNLIVTLILLPVLRPFTRLITRIVKDKPPKKRKSRAKYSVNTKKVAFND